MSTSIRYQVTGMDCTSCVAKIEKAARGVSGVRDVRVSLTAQTMALDLEDPEVQLAEVEGAVRSMGYQLDRIDVSPSSGSDDDDRIPDLSHVTPAYRRALWTVVLLNVGYGAAEIVGSFLADSQALQADSLDFLGDGLVSFLGLVAVGWGLAARARAALVQGIFLGVLGLGVLGATGYRVLVLQQPEPLLMGGFAAAALIVNVLAAVVLIPHRQGDANARAVWLFSRNDAIGNLAVVIAAGVVWWTATPWPDLVVALVVAGLFLQSSWSIIKDARAELRQATQSA